MRISEREEEREVRGIEKGCAVQIVRTDITGRQFELDEAALERILMSEDVRERHVVIISVAGAFRKGKSFLLDFFIRYLDARFKKDNVKDWLGPDDVPLEGFCWKGGSDRITAGILMWSEVYTTRLSSGQDVAILLLDTQGAFDSDSSVCDCATIFALSTMLSSVQIYNISQNIQEDDLQHLQLFTEYGRLALADSGRTPFQKLMFLVRDWSFPYEASYGISGGQSILEKRMQIRSNQHPDMQYLRRHIKTCFADMACFLMPHPGLMVATNPEFDGKLRDIEPDFLYCLECLAPCLLAPENLILKKVSGQMIKAKELYLYFQTYMKIFSGKELPEPKSLLVATAEANNLAAVATAKEMYLLSMEEFCGGGRSYIKSTLLEEEHRRQKGLALNYFEKKLKMGGVELSDRYYQQLNTDLEQMANHYRLNNESKNIFKTARTPTAFMTLAIISYILSNIFLILGLTSLSTLSNLITALAIITLLTWCYSRFSGEYTNVSNLIDTAAERLWEKIMVPIFISLTENQLEDTINTASSNVDKICNRIAEPTVNK